LATWYVQDCEQQRWIRLRAARRETKPLAPDIMSRSYARQLAVRIVARVDAMNYNGTS